MKERAAGFYWVDFGWDSGPVVAQWITAEQVVASYAGTSWSLQPGVEPTGHWELPSDESVQRDGRGVRVLSGRLLAPGEVPSPFVAALRELLDRGPELDAHSFVDWCAVRFAGARDSSSGLIEFYSSRVTKLRAEWAETVGVMREPPPEPLCGECEQPIRGDLRHSAPCVFAAAKQGRCRQIVTDNYGELVELWNCAEGEERIEIDESGRARIYGAPVSGMRSEGYHWTPEGRDLVLELRAKAKGQTDAH